MASEYSAVLQGPRLSPLAGSATGLAILLHGYGSNGADMIAFARHVQPLFPQLEFFAPDAPLGLGPTGRRWFELSSLSITAIWGGVREAAPALSQLIDTERDRLGIADRQIVLIGFSQGTIMALHVGLRRRAPVGAILGYSGMLAGGPAQLADITARPPVTLIHGSQDQVVPLVAMQAGAAALQAAGVPVRTLVVPDLGHTIDPQGLAAGVEVLRSVFVRH